MTRRARALNVVVALAASLLSAQALSVTVRAAEPHDAHAADARSPFVQVVRQATDLFRDVGQTTRAGYVPALGCVSGPEEGAMGVHYVNPGLLMDGELDPAH